MNMNTCKNVQLFQIPEAYVILDLETTGLSFQKDQIIEIGALLVEEGEICGRWHSFIRPDFSRLPGEELSPYVAALTGITKEMLLAAPDFSEMVASLLSFLGQLPIGGHRVDFDISFLDTAVFQSAGIHIENYYFDTLSLSQKLLPELARHRLGDLASYYQIDYTGAHRALRDCEITWECLKAMEATAKASFSSYEAFLKHWETGNRRLLAEEITAQALDFDTRHPFYGKNIVITGVLFSCCRRAAMQKIANLGGNNQNKVTIFTHLLVQGQSSGTTKEKKALRLIAEGYPIQILSEEEFVSCLNWK